MGTPTGRPRSDDDIDDDALTTVSRRDHDPSSWNGISYDEVMRALEPALQRQDQTVRMYAPPSPSLAPVARAVPPHPAPPAVRRARVEASVPPSKRAPVRRPRRSMRAAIAIALGAAIGIGIAMHPRASAEVASWTLPTRAAEATLGAEAVPMPDLIPDVAAAPPPVAEEAPPLPAPPPAEPAASAEPIATATVAPANEDAKQARRSPAAREVSPPQVEVDPATLLDQGLAP